MHKYIMVKIGGDNNRKSSNENVNFAEIGECMNFAEMGENLYTCGNRGEYAICIIG